MNKMELSSILKILLTLSIISANAGVIVGLHKLIHKSGKNFHLYPVMLSLVLLVPFFFIRAYLKSYFPFTDKVESFTTLYFILLIISLIYRREFSAGESVSIIFLGMLSGAAVFLFSHSIRYPSPYLKTIWFPLHVPLSFGAYALWIAAGVRGARIMVTGAGDTMLITSMARIGFILFSLSMIFGGIWGYFAWGAYFLWDPKLIWSVILWIFYGNMLHIDTLASFRHVKHPLYVLGIIMILITFIGTGFFSQSIHRF